jgi:hypothetical protein
LTIGGAVRAVIVGTGVVGAKVWRDRAPEGTAYPYVTFVEPVSWDAAVQGDARVEVRRTALQVDVWQAAPDEDPTIPRTIAVALDGADLTADDHVFRCRVVDLRRLPEPADGVVHHVLDVVVTARA